MYGVELYSKVRMAVLRDGLSQRETARRFGIDRGTVSKMVGHAAPPGYRQAGARVRPKLDAHAGFIDEILKSDLTAPKKQRHTILRIFERLRDERGFDGGYTTVRDYVRPRRLSLKEAFVPLAHPAGHAQADFGEAWAVLGGVRRKVHVLVVDLPQSDAIFLKAYLSETAEALCDGHVAAFDFFGGVPQSILYDNTKLAVAKILGDGTRVRSTLFAGLQSHYLFKDRFGRPGKGNDKGNSLPRTPIRGGRDGGLRPPDLHGPGPGGARHRCVERDAAGALPGAPERHPARGRRHDRRAAGG